MQLGSQGSEHSPAKKRDGILCIDNPYSALSYANQAHLHGIFSCMFFVVSHHPCFVSGNVTGNRPPTLKCSLSGFRDSRKRYLHFPWAYLVVKTPEPCD